MDKFKFEDLNVYQKSLDFVDSVYFQIKEFPKSETYNLSSQFRRAATSIPLNIAEGQGNTNLQFNRFVMIAKSSINECVV
jgi:four helix bundle protein